MAVAPQRFRPAPARRSKFTLLAWVGVVCLIAVVGEIGFVTNGFGLGSLVGKGSHPSPSPANPNPDNERITGMTGAIVYHGGGSGNFPGLSGGNLCPACPILPTVYANASPPVAGVWVYFNVTFTGTSPQSISNFTLTTSGSNPALFTLIGVYTAPRYSESATSLTFTSGRGSTIGLGVFAEATSIPGDGSTGYSLTFSVTSP
jgi:hypothetical protein